MLPAVHDSNNITAQMQTDNHFFIHFFLIESINFITKWNYNISHPKLQTDEIKKHGNVLYDITAAVLFIVLYKQENNSLVRRIAFNI